MSMRTGELARWLGAELIGDPDLEIHRAARIEDAGEGSVSFIANPRYRSFAAETLASALVVSADLPLDGIRVPALLRVSDPYSAFARILERLADQQPKRKGVSEYASIAPGVVVPEDAWIGPFVCLDEGVVLGKGVQLHPFVVLGNRVQIGENSILHPGVTVYADCRIGRSCILHAGAVVGSDGFGFAPQADGSLRKIPQLGHVEIQDQVEIGANTTIDRATLGATILRAGAKIDNLVQIAHNVEIGEYTVMAAQSGVSGSTRIGRGVQIGGQAGLIGHIRIADGTRINAQSGVNRSVEIPHTAITGSPAGPYRSELKAQVIHRQLPELEERVRRLEELVRILEAERLQQKNQGQT